MDGHKLNIGYVKTRRTVMKKLIGIVSVVFVLFSFAVYNAASDPILVGNHVWVCSSLATDIAAISTTKTTLVIKDTQTLASSVEIPATVAVRFERGGGIVLGDYNLTIYGTVDAGRYKIFTCEGTGVVSFTTNYVMTTFYPEWWGAVADDSTDNSTAIQQTINAAETNGGGNIEFAQGYYRITTGLTNDGNNVSFIGTGIRYGTKIITLNSIHILTITTVDPGQISNLMFWYDGVSDATSGSSIKIDGTGLAESVVKPTIRDVMIYRTYDGIWIRRAIHAVIDACDLWVNVRYGIYIDNTTEDDAGDHSISDSLITGGKGGTLTSCIRQESSGGIKISNSKLLYGCYGFDLYFVGNVYPTGDLNIVGNSIEDQGYTEGTTDAAAIRLGSDAAFTFDGICITGNQSRNNYYNGIFLHVNSASVHDIAVVGNAISGTILLSTGDRINIAANQMKKQTGTTVSTYNSYGIYNAAATNVNELNNTFYGFTYNTWGTFAGPQIGTQGGGTRTLALTGTQATSGHSGGGVYMYMADDYDSTDNYWLHYVYDTFLTWSTENTGEAMRLYPSGALYLKSTVHESSLTLDRITMGRKWELLDSIQSMYEAESHDPLDDALKGKIEDTKNPDNVIYTHKPSDLIQVNSECLYELKVLVDKLQAEIEELKRR